MFRNKSAQAMTEYVILCSCVLMMFIAAFSFESVRSRVEAKPADTSGKILTETTIQRYANRIVHNIALPIP